MLKNLAPHPADKNPVPEAAHELYSPAGAYHLPCSGQNNWGQRVVIHSNIAIISLAGTMSQVLCSNLPEQLLLGPNTCLVRHIMLLSHFTIEGIALQRLNSMPNVTQFLGVLRFESASKIVFHHLSILPLNSQDSDPVLPGSYRFERQVYCLKKKQKFLSSYSIIFFFITVLNMLYYNFLVHHSLSLPGARWL